ncbi:MAG: hypothetical protein JO353_06430 [Phycisphaerae bacterium]|nr:hypothetical protein [Phycisphaerae bacterium]
MNNSFESACKGKIAHRDIHSARKALRGTIEQFGDATLVYYRCGHCGKFHVGHPEIGDQRRLQMQRLWHLIDIANATNATNATAGGAR